MPLILVKLTQVCLSISKMLSMLDDMTGNHTACCCIASLMLLAIYKHHNFGVVSIKCSDQNKDCKPVEHHYANNNNAQVFIQHVLLATILIQSKRNNND